MVHSSRWIPLLALVLVSGCGAGSDGSAEPVTIFAASSLAETLGSVGVEWTRQSGLEVRFQFESSSRLARQIEAGAEADLFVTAAPEWLERLETLDRFDWLSNRLVLVATRSAGEVDLARLSSIALASEEVPAGKYARAALARQGVNLPSRVILASSARDVLTKVAHGAAEAGIVYATDARIDPDLRTVHEFPSASHPPILYSVGLLSERGRGFFEALRRPAALEIAREHGFLAAPR